MTNVIPLHRHIDRQWQAYVDALRRAEQSLSIQDGIAAGKAWRAWLNLFMTADQRNFLDGPGKE
ncbi:MULTISPECIES: hypothetical protein [unclassified Rhizobium]|uniref:hypothetical protein n=1 Tax=unclassified Rhizobium TaxID=2613769 RepID=UPI00161A4FF3|nr:MULTISPECIES: hypothetical protein [unclassified Rhizobium]MBB3385527.1 hypothetical protein [Rhizobium sp. BK098]MBB3617232.1 hypothetical protein [Rhizobium sp. BK609]MBB3682932.1 hypothetical protein [Rhizobium sp. BK612]